MSGFKDVGGSSDTIAGTYLAHTQKKKLFPNVTNISTTTEVSQCITLRVLNASLLLKRTDLGWDFYMNRHLIAKHADIVNVIGPFPIRGGDQEQFIIALIILLVEKI